MDIESTMQPMETIYEILSKLHGKDLLNAIEVCTTFHDVMPENERYKARCEAANINMNLFKPLRYSNYRDMFIDQVILKSYTFILNDRYHLKFAVLGNMLLIIICQYRKLDSNVGVGYIATLPMAYFFYDPKLKKKDFKDRTEEQDYQRCFISHRTNRYLYFDNPYGRLFTIAVNKVCASKLITDCWKRAAFPSYDKLRQVHQSQIYEMELFVAETLRELLLFGEVRYLLGRSFSFKLPRYQKRPLLIDLDEDERLNIINDGCTWLAPMFLYYHLDEDVWAMVPNHRMPPRFSEWLEFQKSNVYDHKNGWGYSSRSQELLNYGYKSYYAETYDAANEIDRYYHLEDDYSADYRSDDDVEPDEDVYWSEISDSIFTDDEVDDEDADAYDAAQRPLIGDEEFYSFVE